jgi:hypothetical protein
MRGYLQEGAHWASCCLTAAGIAQQPRARALAVRGILGVWAREYELAAEAFVEASETARETGDDRSLAYADLGLGLITALTSSIGPGLDQIRRGIATFRAIGDEVGVTSGLAAVGWAQAITRQFEDDETEFRRTREHAQQVGSEIDTGIAEYALAQFLMERGGDGEVYDLIEASLDRLSRARHMGSTILTLEVIAELGIEVFPSEAVAIFGATGSIREAMGTQVPPAAAARLQTLIERGRAALGDGFVTSYGQGADMSFAEAVDHGRTLVAEMRAQDIGATPRPLVGPTTNID